ncbi:DUF3325 domain-containing protein [Herbaspirillum lusitanum]|uniref:DUF3325 domain-containing protein n=1 Tax=Herbaspirillum lusitanum TaxID=213312 RepID=UPI0002FC7B3D|nr:DUF3325 domain-containing protein [Herbaspirillum lusitanum]
MSMADLIPLPFLATLALTYSAWVALSLAMDRHYADITLALTAAFAVCVRDSGWGIGPVAWLGTMTVAALLLVLQLCYAPKSVPRTGKPALWLALLLTLATGLV